MICCRRGATALFMLTRKLVQWSKENGILVESYSPLGSTGAPQMEDEVVQAIAKSHGATPAQVLISWQAARGVIVLPKSVTADRIKSNFKGERFRALIVPVGLLGEGSLTLVPFGQRSS